MIKDEWSPNYRIRVPLTRKQWAELNKIEFCKGIKGYEACISQIRRQKTKLKLATHPQGDSTLFKKEYWNHLNRKSQKVETKNTTIRTKNVVLIDL
jgi:hypothetical protein